MTISSTDMTRGLRRVASAPGVPSTFLREVADTYAEAVGEHPGLLARISTGGINEQAYELAGHASRRAGIGAMDKLWAAVCTVAQEHGLIAVVPQLGDGRG